MYCVPSHSLRQAQTDLSRVSHTELVEVCAQGVDLTLLLKRLIQLKLYGYAKVAVIQYSDLLFIYLYHDKPD